MATSKLQPLSLPIGHVLARVAGRGKAALLNPVWRSAVGAPLASRSRPVSLVGRVLTVLAEAGLALELEAAKDEIARRLEGMLGHAVDLVIVEGKLE